MRPPLSAASEHRREFGPESAESRASPCSLPPACSSQTPPPAVPYRMSACGGSGGLRWHNSIFCEKEQSDSWPPCEAVHYAPTPVERLFWFLRRSYGAAQASAPRRHDTWPGRS